MGRIINLFIYLPYSKYRDFVSNQQNIAKRDEPSMKQCKKYLKKLQIYYDGILHKHNVRQSTTSSKQST